MLRTHCADVRAETGIPVGRPGAISQMNNDGGLDQSVRNRGEEQLDTG